MLKQLTACAVLAGALLLGIPTHVQAGNVAVHGSTTVLEMIVKPNKAKIERKSGQRLSLLGNGSGQGIKDLMAGKAQVAMISAPLDAVVSKLNQKDPGSVDGSLLVPHLVGAARLAFIVNKANKVTSLTIKQVTDIYAGRITNWKQVGGKDAPIIPVIDIKGTGTRAMVEKKLLYGGDVVGTAMETKTGSEIIQAVATNPDAIGISMEQSVVTSVRQLQVDRSIERPLIFITMGEPKANVARVIAATRSVGFF